MAELQTSFRSQVNTWQCDENDHLNVQFYTAFADDASIAMLALLGFGATAQQAARLTVEPLIDHIRYWKELRVQDAMEIGSAPVEVMVDRIVLYHELRNSYDGAVCATIVRTVQCRDAAGDPAPFPSEIVERAKAWQVALPDQARPRNAGRFGPLPTMTPQEALAHGMMEISRSVVNVEECDGNGYLRPRFAFARFSDGAGILWHNLGFNRIAMRDDAKGTVVLETRTVYRRRLGVGTPTRVITGLIDATDKALQVIHFLFDAESGELAAIGEAVAILFDQKTRRSMAMSAEDKIRVDGRIIKMLRGGN